MRAPDVKTSAESRPLVSVIVNNYNYARFLGDAVDSALAQTYSPLEVLVVDDGSTDDSREIIAGYGGRVIPVLKENGGQASAFNAGFAASRGDVVIFLDADDVLLPDAAARAVPLFHDNVVKVHWPVMEIDADGKPRGKLQPERALAEGDLRDRTIIEGPLAGVAPPTSGNAWSRALLHKLLPVPETEFRINTDGYLHTLVWIYGSVCTISEPLSLYRIHGSNHFASMSLEGRLERHREKFVHQCGALARHLREQGASPRPDIWKLKKLIYDEEVEAGGKAELRALLPADARIILADEDAWADPSKEEPLAGREIIRFPSHDGVYWGRPETDAEAIVELERLRAAGADYLVFPWFTAWWLNQYPAFREHLWQTCSPGVWTDFLSIYDLRWAHRVSELRDDIDAIVPPGEPFVLVDEGALANESKFGKVKDTSRAISHFFFRDGCYIGLPADDAAALDELTRLREAGARFIIFPWFAFWWLEYYQALARHLHDSYRILASSNNLIVFEARE